MAVLAEDAVEGNTMQRIKSAVPRNIKKFASRDDVWTPWELFPPHKGDLLINQ